MEWTKEETIRLIETYQKRDLIWDPKHVHHYNKLRKQDAWEEIAEEMGKSVDECKRKMDYLLAALRREKMKMKRNIGIRKGVPVYNSSWFAFDSLKFLWDKNKPKPTLKTTATSEADDRPKEEHLEAEELSTSLATSPSPERKKLKTSDRQRLDAAFEILTSLYNQINDESHHFGNLVASKLRFYDDKVRCLIQSDILNLFVRANEGYYNND